MNYSLGNSDRVDFKREQKHFLTMTKAWIHSNVKNIHILQPAARKTKYVQEIYMLYCTGSRSHFIVRSMSIALFDSWKNFFAT